MSIPVCALAEPALAGLTLEYAGSLFLSILAGVALAASAGFRAFVPLLVLSAAARVGLVHLHEGVRFLESDLALTALVIAAVVEILADKIPVVDHLLDVGGTFVRPAVGFVAGLALFADLPEGVSIALALLMAILTLGTHLGHAKTRVGSTVLTAGIGNPLISFFEDLLSFALAVLAILAPLVALGLVVLCGYLLWRLWRSVRRRTLPH